MREFPTLDFELHAPVICEPPLCTLKELEDGTYSYPDLVVMLEMLDYKKASRPKPKGN